ncbi:MAG: DUF2190 domain-containing protein [Pseudomonadota bacterium]|nr:DUF2190 domain-containing protein [Pseudomonadota bacterium]
MQTSKALYGQTVRATAAVKGRTFAGYTGATCAAGAAAMGAFRTDAAVGEYVTVEQIGTALVIAGGPIAAGSAVESDAFGQAVEQTTGVVVGRAVNAGAPDQAVEIFLIAA